MTPERMVKTYAAMTDIKRFDPVGYRGEKWIFSEHEIRIVGRLQSVTDKGFVGIADTDSYQHSSGAWMVDVLIQGVL